jgi:hypothetical protein
MQRRFGNVTVLDCAVKIAAEKGCTLASIHGSPQCSVQVFDLEFWTWGKLRDAQAGDWHARLFCRRRFAALKRAKSCPGAYELDIETLITAPLAGDLQSCRATTMGARQPDI